MADRRHVQKQPFLIMIIKIFFLKFESKKNYARGLFGGERFKKTGGPPRRFLSLRSN